MPEVMTQRAGMPFFHRDSRLKTAGRHPKVVKSLDLSDVFPRYPGGLVRFDYGYAGDGRLRVEIALYRPSRFLHWSYRCIDVETLRMFEAPAQELREIARTLRANVRRLASTIIAHAPAAAPAASN